MAAVLDLKGMIIRKNNQDRATPQIVLVVDSKNEKVIRQLCELTGCQEHCPEAHVHADLDWQMPPTSRWTVTGVSAAMVLYTIMPYMCGDRSEYLVAMNQAIANAAVTGKGSGATKAAIRRLSRAGWEVPPVLMAKMLPDVEETMTPHERKAIAS
jgi:hypothetical protein